MHIVYVHRLVFWEPHILLFKIAQFLCCVVLCLCLSYSLFQRFFLCIVWSFVRDKNGCFFKIYISRCYVQQHNNSMVFFYSLFNSCDTHTHHTVQLSAAVTSSISFSIIDILCLSVFQKHSASERCMRTHYMHERHWCASDTLAF